MPDFAMCLSSNCPSSTHCKRHADSGTKPNSWQWYGDLHPVFHTGRCDDYLEADMGESE